MNACSLKRDNRWNCCLYLNYKTNLNVNHHITSFCIHFVLAHIGAKPHIPVSKNPSCKTKPNPSWGYLQNNWILEASGPFVITTPIPFAEFGHVVTTWPATQKLSLPSVYKAAGSNSGILRSLAKPFTQQPLQNFQHLLHITLLRHLLVVLLLEKLADRRYEWKPHFDSAHSDFLDSGWFFLAPLLTREMHHHPAPTSYLNILIDVWNPAPPITPKNASAKSWDKHRKPTSFNPSTTSNYLENPPTILVDGCLSPLFHGKATRSIQWQNVFSFIQCHRQELMSSSGEKKLRKTRRVL